MGTFTVLGDSQLAELAETFMLGTLRSHRTIAAGTVNSNFALETEDGRFFLRVNEGKSEADVAWECRVVTLLAVDGVPTPAPLATRDGHPYAAVPGAPTQLVTAYRWRPGHHLDAGDVSALHTERLGAALALLHVRGAALTFTGEPTASDHRIAAAARLLQPPHTRVPPIELRASIYDHAHLVDRFERQIEPSQEPALASAKRVLRAELEAAKAAAPVRRAATHGLIHGDLFRDNVLWEHDAISALLDFEQASGGSLVYDLAVCINDWCWSERDAAPRLDLAGAMLRGYQAVRVLSEADRAALPVEVRAAAARFTITRITDVYLAKVDNPEKDFRAFLARCEAWGSSALQALSELV